MTRATPASGGETQRARHTVTEVRRRPFPRRHFLFGLTTLPLVMVSCRSDQIDLGSGSLDGARLMDESAAAGRLRARPRPLEAIPSTSAGVQRLDLDEGSALVYVPEGHRADRPSPLAVMFHGAGGTADDGLALLRPFADAAGLVLLAPKSRGPTWDLLVRSYGPDVALIDAALRQVFDRYLVDPGHLAVGGFSDGASYALSLGAINGDLFGNVIAFSPGFWVPGDGEGSPSFFITHGTNDRVLPIASTSRRLVPMLERAGYEVNYHEFEGDHVVPGDLAADAVMWFLGAP